MGLKLGKILKGAVKIVDQALLGGIISNKKDNTVEYPTGRIDYARLIGGIASSLALLVFLYLLATGKISFDEFKEGIEATQ